MTLEELGDFTLDELGDFTLDELSLPIDEFIAYIKKRNVPIPIDMYEKLLSIAGKLHIDTATSTTSNMTVKDKLVIIELLIKIIIAVLSFAGLSQTDNTYNIFIDTQVQIQSLSDTNPENVDDICNQILEALSNHKP